MIPVESRQRRVQFFRNRSGFLLGASWSHSPGWSPRLTHFYLGWWALTVFTNRPAPEEGP